MISIPRYFESKEPCKHKAYSPQTTQCELWKKKKRILSKTDPDRMKQRKGYHEDIDSLHSFPNSK